jgi:hypothetical protein
MNKTFIQDNKRALLKSSAQIVNLTSLRCYTEGVKF